MPQKLQRKSCDDGLRCEKSACLSRSCDAKCLRFGLWLRFGLRRVCLRCQITSDVGWAMRITEIRFFSLWGGYVGERSCGDFKMGAPQPSKNTNRIESKEKKHSGLEAVKKTPLKDFCMGAMVPILEGTRTGLGVCLRGWGGDILVE